MLIEREKYQVYQWREEEPDREDVKKSDRQKSVGKTSENKTFSKKINKKYTSAPSILRDSDLPRQRKTRSWRPAAAAADVTHSPTPHPEGHSLLSQP